MILNTEAMRVVVRDDRGRVRKRTRYSRGQFVDTSEMNPLHVQNLIDKGTLVESEEDLSEGVDPMDLAPHSGVTGAATEGHGAVVPGPDVRQSEEDDSIAIPSDSDGGDPDDPDNPPLVDQYDDMDYAALQRAAKARDLSGGGSADDLRERLREADKSN